MKFKNLRNLAEEFSKLNENSSTNVAAPEFHAGTPIGDVDSNHMYIENQQNRDKLNFWLKTMNPTNKPVYNMHDFLINVRMKLNFKEYFVVTNKIKEFF